MRTRSLMFIMLFLVFWRAGSVPMPDSGDTWSTSWPEGGDILCLAIDPLSPDILFAGTQTQGMYKSIDGGANWYPINNGMPLGTVNAVAIAPNDPLVVYAGIYADPTVGIIKSKDGGASWNFVRGTNLIYDIAIDPTDPKRVYVGQEGGFLKTEDGGGTWFSINPAGPEAGVTAIAIDPQQPGIIYAGVRSNGKPLGVYKTENYGITWTSMSTDQIDPTIRQLAVVSTAPNIIYAATSGGLYRSEDSAQTWSKINEIGLNIAIDPTNPSKLYSGGSTIVTSTDGGATWNMVVIDYSLIHRLVVNPASPNIVYAATSKGMYKSINSGTNWAAINGGLTGTNITALTISAKTPTTLYAGTWQHGLWKSTDGGESWNQIDRGFIWYIMSIVIDPQDPSQVYLGTDNGGLYKSTNGGESWGTNSWLGGGVRGLVVHPSDSNTLYCTSSPGVFKSTDGGQTWASISNGLPTDIRLRTLAIDTNTPTTLYTGSDNDNRLWKSTDEGANWALYSTGLPLNSGFHITSIVIDPITPGVLYVTSNGNGVFKTTDEGVTWWGINRGLTNKDVRALTIDPITPSTLYAGTNGSGVFVSYDRGLNWAPFEYFPGGANDNRPAAPLSSQVAYVHHLAMSSRGSARQIFAGTDSAVWSVQEKIVNPYQISQNHTYGRPGSYFTLTGFGYPLYSQVRVVVNDQAVGEIQVDANGEFAIQLHTLDADPGYYKVVLIGANRSLETALFLDHNSILHPEGTAQPVLEIPAGIGLHLAAFLPIVSR